MFVTHQQEHSQELQALIRNSKAMKEVSDRLISRCIRSHENEMSEDLKKAYRKI